MKTEQETFESVVKLVEKQKKILAGEYFDEEVRAHSPYKTLTWKEQSNE
jgi:hypothetical protein